MGQYKSAPTIEMLIFASPDVGKVALNSTRASRNRPVIECLTLSLHARHADGTGGRECTGVIPNLSQS